MRLFIILCLSLLIYSCQESNADQAFQSFLSNNDSSFDIWIKNGLVYEGLDKEPQISNILISSDTISYIGWVDSTLISADRIIDAKGYYISPGFIDPHAHGNPINTPEFQNFLAMGVTSIFLGQDGFSPTNDNLAKWMEKAAAAKPGPNIGIFVGHSSLRQISGVNYDSIPSKEGLQKMTAILEQSLLEGCFGMSTGLEYNPGSFARLDELNHLAQTVGKYNGLITSHIRNEDDPVVESSIKELLAQAEYCRVNVSHMKSVYGKGRDRAEQLLDLLYKSPSKFEVSADVYPYTASYTGIGIVFPDWAKGPNNYESVKKERRNELLEYLRKKVISRNGPESTLLGTEPYKGKTLAQISEESNKPFEEELLEIGPRGASGAYFVMDEALQDRLIQDTLVMICSDGSPTMNHPRGYGSFAKIIEKMVIGDQLLSLEEATYKMSTKPARIYGLSDRGDLSPGKKADILIFKPEEIKARATFPEPHQLSTGFHYVLVNGKLAIDKGEFTGIKNGVILKKESSKN